MKLIELTQAEAKAYYAFESHFPMSMGHQLIEIPDPKDPSHVLIGVVHPHASGRAIKNHKDYIKRELENDPTDTGH